MEKLQKPLFELRPQIAVAIIPIILGGLIASAFIGAFVGFLVKSFLVGLLSFLVFLVFNIFFRFMNLNSRKYVFYKDKIEFYEGFLNIVQRTVRYSMVTDCVLSKSVWDRMFGTGTIRLLTAGHFGVNTGGYNMGNVSGGVAVQFVDRPDEVFSRVEKLLGK